MTDASQPIIDIRVWDEGDYLMVERVMGDPAMTQYLGGPESPEKLRERHERYCQIDGTGTGAMFVVVVGAERIPAGSVGYWKSEWDGELVWETGWSILREFQGQGLATRATTLILDKVRAEQSYRYLHAFPSIENGASNAVCRKLGFTLRGEVSFEFPIGHWIRGNNWRLDLFEGQS